VWSCPGFVYRSAALTEAVVGLVVADGAVSDGHREGGEEASTVVGDAWARGQRVVGDGRVLEDELRVWWWWEEHVVPDPASKRFPGGSGRGGGAVGDRRVADLEQSVAVFDASAVDRRRPSLAAR
jgi:hypothetical protein